MIDLDELQAAINRCAFDGDVLGLSKAECSDLLTRLRQAEKDAARYRWLRDSGVENLFSYQQDMRSKYWDEDIDAEIEAMQCNK